ncbi:flocculation protein FLO11-like [Varroa destructor]|uniref:Uncharacterized protein n=1 Tax=Varroa destructor TaxID=109461 RepID=A0A7M7L4K8_VARDE|nr:flocculation protein FLO11-like [Varroa destructor]
MSGKDGSKLNTPDESKHSIEGSTKNTATVVEADKIDDVNQPYLTDTKKEKFPSPKDSNSCQAVKSTINIDSCNVWKTPDPHKTEKLACVVSSSKPVKEGDSSKPLETIKVGKAPQFISSPNTLKSTGDPDSSRIFEASEFAKPQQLTDQPKVIKSRKEMGASKVQPDHTSNSNTLINKISNRSQTGAATKTTDSRTLAEIVTIQKSVGLKPFTVTKWGTGVQAKPVSQMKTGTAVKFCLSPVKSPASVKAGAPVKAATLASRAKSAFVSKSIESTRVGLRKGAELKAPGSVKSVTTATPADPKKAKSTLKLVKTATRSGHAITAKRKATNSIDHVQNKKGSQPEIEKKIVLKKPSATPRSKPTSWTSAAENLTPPLRLRPSVGPGEKISHSESKLPISRRSRRVSNENVAVSTLDMGMGKSNQILASMTLAQPPTTQSSKEAAVAELALKASSPNTREDAQMRSPPGTADLRLKSTKKTNEDCQEPSTPSNTSSCLISHRAEKAVFTITKFLQKPVPTRSRDRIPGPVKNAQGMWIEPPVFLFGDPKTGKSLYKRISQAEQSP